MTSTAYYPTIKWYYYNATGAAWVDISGYVLTKQGVSGHWGMRSNKYTDRLASTGEMRLLLDNATGVFDPDDASALTGWAINTKVKMVVTFDGVNYTRFYGKVDSIKLVNPTSYEFTAQVLVTDWMGYAYKKTLGEQSIETYKRGGELCAEIVTAVGQTPLATSYATGDYEFPAAFDSVTTTTKAATELNKIVLSENGYFYNRHDKVNGETLVFEAESTRNGLRTVSKLPKLAADCGDVLMAGSATDHVLMAGSATDKVVMNETQDAHINGTAQAYQRTHGENILNKVTVTAYPKRVDTTQQTIYSLGTPIMLAPGETKTITVKYQNSSTKESCNAITDLCSQPVATTDYLMNRNKAGTSTNTTSSLTVSVVFHTASADVTLTSASGYTGYVTRLYLKGYGVYQDSPIKAEAEDSTSQTAYGVQELNIEQQYQRDTNNAITQVYQLLYAEKEPRTKLDGVSFVANKSSAAMLAFLSLDVGDVVRITESSLGIDDDYYIQGVEFSVQEGEVIMFKWIIGIAVTLCAFSLTPVSVEFTNQGDENVIFNKPLGTLEQMTVMVTYDMDSFGNTSIPQVLVSRLPEFLITIGTESERIQFWRLFDTQGIWVTDNNSFTTGEHNIAISHDAGSTANDPVIYLDGVSVNVNELYTPTGNALHDPTASVLVGGSNDWATLLSPDGDISRVKIYNRILSGVEVAAEVATPGTVTSGLVFSGMSVPTYMTTYYDGKTLSTNDKLFDEIDFKMGTPNGSPVSSLLP